MGFLAPWFLGGALLVGLPIWLHLLKTHRTVPLPFASLMFFERRTQSSTKHRRLTYLLLLTLRLLLLLLLALAFASPFINRAPGAIGGQDKLTVLAIDHSYSMRQGDRLDRAKREASGVLSSLSPGAKAQAIAFSSGVTFLGDPTAEVPALRAVVSAIRPGDGRGSYAELARALRSIAQSARTPVEAHLFSDIQKSSWPANFADARLGDGVKLVIHPLAAKRLPNFAVESVNAPRHLYDPKKIRVVATVAGYGTEKATRRATLLVNGKEAGAKTVEVSAGGRAVAEFLSLDASYGLNRCEVRIDSADAFPDDDHFYFSVERSDPRRVLFVHDGRGQRDLVYFRTAIEASSDAAFAIDELAVDRSTGASPERYALVVLSDAGNLPASFEEALAKYVRSGGSVWIALGRYAPPAGGRVPVFGETVSEARYSEREGERFRTVGYLDPAHPAIRGASAWEGVKFYRSVKVDPGRARVVARLSDETPLLLEKRIGEGRVLLFTSTFDNLANDFPLHASFVPFIVETSRYLGRLDDSNPSWTVGAFFDLRASIDRGLTVEVLDPAGTRALTLEESAKAPNIALSSQGFWDVRRPSGRHELVAVNPDRRESDLDVLSAETLTLWQNTGQGGVAASGSDAEPEKKPRSFWWPVMFAALVLVIAETIVGNRHLAIDKGEA